MQRCREACAGNSLRQLPRYQSIRLARFDGQRARRAEVRVGLEHPRVRLDELVVERRRVRARRDVPAVRQVEQAVDVGVALHALEGGVVEEEPDGESSVLVDVVDPDRQLHPGAPKPPQEAALDREHHLLAGAHRRFADAVLVVIVVRKEQLLVPASAPAHHPVERDGAPRGARAELLPGDGDAGEDDDVDHGSDAQGTGQVGVRQPTP